MSMRTNICEAHSKAYHQRPSTRIRAAQRRQIWMSRNINEPCTADAASSMIAIRANICEAHPFASKNARESTRSSNRDGHALIFGTNGAKPCESLTIQYFRRTGILLQLSLQNKQFPFSAYAAIMLHGSVGLMHGQCSGSVELGISGSLQGEPAQRFARVM